MGSQLFHIYHIFSEDTVYQSRLEICVFILAKATKFNLDRNKMCKLKVNTGSCLSVDVYLLQAVLCQHATKALKCICVKLWGQNHINPPLSHLYSKWQQAQVT